METSKKINCSHTLSEENKRFLEKFCDSIKMNESQVLNLILTLVQRKPEILIHNFSSIFKIE